MQKVLLTGSAGFVGSYLIEELKKDYSILGIINTKNPVPQTNVLFKQLDLTNNQAVFETLNSTKPDIIIHLAAITKVTENDFIKLMDVNFNATFYLLDAIVRIKKSEEDYNPKFLYISSAETYGKTIHPEKITEENPLYPGNPYGVSKTAADRLCYQYSQTHKLNITILRPFTHTGPGQQLGFFVPDMCSQIVELEKDNNANTIKVGNLEATRDYTDVRDVVKAYKLAIERDLPSGETFNICSGKGIKMKVMLEKLLKLSSKKITIEQDPSRLRPSDIPILVGSNEKFRKATGWKPTISIDQMLSDSLEFWRNQKS